MRKGFTLIEIMVAISVFLVVMVISLGAILSVFAANSTSQSQKAVLDNLNSALESMSREMRFGSNYHCEASIPPVGNITLPQDCNTGGVWLSFLSQQGQEIVYQLNGSTLEESVDGGITFIPLTSPDINIESLKFYAVGTPPPPDTRQPKIFIRVRGLAGSKLSTQTEFSIQTLISERKLDNT